MGRWLVTQKDDVQFAVESLEELQDMAKSGKLKAGDMVQPDGSSEWVYASEIDDLKGHLKDDQSEEVDLSYRRGMGGAAVAGVLAVVFIGVLVVGGVMMAGFYSQLPDPNQNLFSGDNSLSFSQMIATNDAALRDGPAGDAKQVGTVSKDAAVELLAKRKDFYKVRTEGGAEGWVGLTDVIPLYTLGDAGVKEEMDPLFNPDRYVIVSNANWLQLDRKNEQLTVFRFEMQNQSKYPMTDLVLQATIKDSKGNEIEQVEIPIDGIIPPLDRTMVGTLGVDPSDKEGEPQLLTHFTFEELSAEDPDLQLRYSDGVEVQMQSEDFTEASIDLLELRAVPRSEGSAEG